MQQPALDYGEYRKNMFVVIAGLVLTWVVDPAQKNNRDSFRGGWMNYFFCKPGGLTMMSGFNRIEAHRTTREATHPVIPAVQFEDFCSLFFI
jgi:hypothetical protein